MGIVVAGQLPCREEATMPVFARLRGLAILTVAFVGLGGATVANAGPLTVASEQKFVLPAPEGGEEFGWSVALDGDTVVVGADVESPAAGSAGVVHVYAGSTATPQATLTGSDAAPGDNLGVSVAVDGDAILAGAFHRFAPTPAPGKAYVFRRTGTTWAEEAKFVAPDGQNNDAFGWSVALVGDIAVVGAPLAWIGPPFGSSKVYTFVREDDGTWIYDGKLTRPGEYTFGWSLAFDGTTLVVGASLGPNNSPGRVFVYERDPGGFWNFRQELSPSDLSPQAEFGNAVAVSGNHMLIGAWFNTAGSPAGSAYFYDLSGGTWTQSAKFDAPDGAASETFGEAVTIDGDRAIVTDSGLDVNGAEDIGAAYLFQHDPDSGWKSAGTLRATGGLTGDYFGTAAAMRGSRILIGAPYYIDDPSETQPGAAYLMQLAAGSKLVIKNAAPDNESKNVVSVKAKGLSVDLPFPGSPDDPTCAGGGAASLEIWSMTSGTGFSQLLPCKNWEQTTAGYHYRDRELDDGPCKDVYYRPAGTTTMKCTGKGPSALNFDLEPGVTQVPIVVRLTMGSESYCTTFGGTLKYDGTDGLKLTAINGGATEVCTAP